MNGLHVRPTRWWPCPTRRGWALCAGVVLAALVLALGAAHARADEQVVLPGPDLPATVTPAPAWTATPTEPTEVARAEPASRGGGRRSVAEVAADHFPPAWVGWAIRTAACESGGDLYARSSGYDRRLGVYYDFRGALQVDAVTWSAKARELFDGELDDPDVNFAMAAWILAHYGPSHWPYCGR